MTSTWHSGLQRQVLSLYRDFIVATRTKPEGPEREALLLHVRSKFKDGATTLKRSNVEAIERRLRDGKKQLAILQLPGTEGISSFGPSNK